MHHQILYIIIKILTKRHLNLIGIMTFIVMHLTLFRMNLLTFLIHLKDIWLILVFFMIPFLLPQNNQAKKKGKKKAPPNESHPHDVPVTKRHKKPRFEKHNLQEINNQVSSINIPQTVAPQTSSPGNKILPPSPQLSGILRKYSPKISEQLPSYGIHNLATFCMHSSIRDILEDSLDVKHLTASRLINEVNTAYQASLSSPTSLPLFDSLHTSIAGLY
mmetsp:Transcript_26098/g.32858  ORF Transcript_26098/g.32858 Transcript_26098/m.32858 type:complete len:218 (+) Transcript_26098:128-781(+)